jgi:hypothetical protein
MERDIWFPILRTWIKRKYSQHENSAQQKSEPTLLNYLNGTSWALGFACSADQAIIYFDWDRFAVLHFVDAYRATVYAGFASGTSIVVDYYFNQFSITF